MTSICIYLPPWVVRHFDARDDNKWPFWRTLISELKEEGYKVSIAPQDEDTPLTAGIREDFAIINKALTHESNVFTFRDMGLNPFLSIENQQMRSAFRANQFPIKNVNDPDWSYARLCEHLLKSKENLTKTPRGEEVLVPLQGEILKKRIEDKMDAISMLRAIRSQAPNQKISIRVHPKFELSQREQDALNIVIKECDLSMSEGTLDQAILRSNYLVGLNSSVHLRALFYGRPSIFYGGVDYARSGLSVYEGLSEKTAFDNIAQASIDYQAFLEWYFSLMIYRRVPDGPAAAIRVMKSLGLPSA